MRQRFENSGTFLNEATRTLILIVAVELNRAERERESDEAFSAARRQHPAVESAINALEHRGLDRVRSRGDDGFARTVALSVLAANLHRLGQLLRQRERKRRRRAA